MARPTQPTPDNPLRADKRLGQHFLHDKRVIGRIVQTLPPATTAPEVIEIGPGTGALTTLLLEAGYRVQVVEKDPRWQALMQGLGAETGGRVTVAGDDALTVDWPALLAAGQPVIGNLPYNVGTEIVARLVMLAAMGKAHPPVMVFMLQKEVVERICARPGGSPGGKASDWGRLGVLCDLLCEREDLFDVAPGAFSPPPKVMSSVVRLTPLPRPRFDVDLAKLDLVVRQAFGQRRKMLRASLRGLLDEARIAAAGLDPTLRPEMVTTENFCRLAGMI